MAEKKKQLLYIMEEISAEVLAARAKLAAKFAGQGVSLSCTLLLEVSFFPEMENGNSVLALMYFYFPISLNPSLLSV